MLDMTQSPLDEWKARDEGRVLMTGVQALVRLPLLQRRLDAAAGLKTAGYVSGYRGSPLGGVDTMIARNVKDWAAEGVTFQPGLNEELAATALWGTQQIDALPDATVDGVFGYWYGKGPGVERAADALRHGANAGSHRNGGVLVVYGDDHPGKSSTTAHQSEQTLAALQIPSLYPADVSDYLRFGLLGWAMARYSGAWVGIKCVNETVEQTLSVDLDLGSIAAVLPALGEGDVPPQGLHIRPRAYNPQEVESIVTRYRLPLVARFVRANGIDRAAFGAATPRLGIVTAGKAWHDVLQALSLLGIDSAQAEKIGLGVYKVGCIWPLEPEGLREFAGAAGTLLFVEEKKAFLEAQAREILYNDPKRPAILGKAGPKGEMLLASDIQLQPADVARAITTALAAAGIDLPGLEARAAALPVAPGKPAAMPPRNLIRTPYFCSGCPHGRSTQVPEGSVGFAGIGCHAMASLRTSGDTLPPTQMGGEGANWIGMSRYAGRKHVFQNLGDGTYLHSGLLAIRAAVASGTNITYKVLYNDAVAMTGGQPHDAPLTVEEIVAQVGAEGVARIVVVSETPERFGPGSFPAPVVLKPRDAMMAVQEELREVAGTTVIVYDQTCAAEKRRRRKKGRFPDPAKRMFIFDEVCEGCGDCSTASTCVSLEPLDTALGTKRRINQSSCNKDFSCAEGFCPSFVTVLGKEPEAAKLAELGDLGAGLPVPARAEGPISTMIAGIGGTGVITVGAILARAAHGEGFYASAYDMTGLSQKNGAVFSHLRIGRSPDEIGAQRVGLGEADLVLAFDLLAAIQPEAATTIAHGRTKLVGNSDVAVTAFFQMDRTDAGRPIAGAAETRLGAAVGEGNAFFVNATKIAEALCGDTIAVNLMLVGYAAQKGLLPVSLEAIDEAIGLNGVQVAFNRRAFLLGRVLAHAPERLTPFLGKPAPAKAETVDAILAERMPRLRAFQNDAWAKGYADFVGRVRATAGDGDFTKVVASNLAKLMTYKDEYEVARLYSSPAFRGKLSAEFGDVGTMKFNLAPPLFARKDPRTGHLKKREYGGWMLRAFGLLAAFRGLRGTAFDPFGYTGERKMERALIADYRGLVEKMLPHLGGPKAATAIAIVRLPEMIRGYGHVKEANVARYRARLAELEAELAAPMQREAAE